MPHRPTRGIIGPHIRQMIDQSVQKFEPVQGGNFSAKSGYLSAHGHGVMTVELADDDVSVLEKLLARTDRQPRTLRDFLARERLETRFDQHLPGHRQQVIELLLATLLRGSPARLEYFDAHGPHPSVLLAHRRKSSVDEREDRKSVV